MTFCVLLCAPVRAFVGSCDVKKHWNQFCHTGSQTPPEFLTSLRTCRTGSFSNFRRKKWPWMFNSTYSFTLESWNQLIKMEHANCDFNLSYVEIVGPASAKLVFHGYAPAAPGSGSLNGPSKNLATRPTVKALPMGNQLRTATSTCSFPSKKKSLLSSCPSSSFTSRYIVPSSYLLCERGRQAQ